MNNIREIVKRSDILVFLVIVPLFFALLGACGHYWYTKGLGAFEITCAVSAYYISNISVGIGLHRLWAHGSYKAHPILSKILVVTSTFCLQGSALKWASDHKRHHAYADTEKDPHTPTRFPDSKLKGFLWSHVGWMIVDSPLWHPVDEGTMKTLGKDPWLRFQYDHYAMLATIMNTLVPAAIGYFYGGINYIYPALIFIGFGRALQQQMTFCVNSICHMFGKRRHANDTSGDIWMLWPLLLGENWHNFHHAFGNDYRCGHKWYYFDVHKWIIWTLSKVGLAKNLVVTSDARIAAKEREMNEFLVSQTLSLFDKVGISVQSLLDKIPSRLSTLSNELKDIDIKSFGKAKAKQSEQKLLGGINALSARLVALQSKIAKIVNNTEFEASKMANKFGEKLLHSCMTEFDKLHKRAQKLGIV